MKKPALTMILILFLAGCASTGGDDYVGPKPRKDKLWDAYLECQQQNLIVKTDEKGIVALDKERKPIMIPNPNACKEENEAWNRKEEARERRRHREAKLQCPGDLMPVCYGTTGCSRRHIENRSCSCQCMPRGQAMDQFRNIFNRSF